MTDTTDEEIKLNPVVTQGEGEKVESEPAVSESVEKTEGPTGAEHEESEATDESDEGETEEYPSGKKGGFQRKLEKLASENEVLKRQLQTLTGAQAPTGEPAPKPKVDDFETYDDYLANLAEWHVDNKTRRQAEELREHLVRQEQEAQLVAFKQSAAEFHKTTPDYLDVLKSVDDIQVPPAVQQMLLAVDNGPALMYELAKNREKLAKLAKLSPVKAALQIGAMSADIRLNKSTPPVSRAPAPLKPLGTSNPSVGKAPEDMTMAEYRAWRATQ